MCYPGHCSNSACSFSCLSNDFSLAIYEDICVATRAPQPPSLHLLPEFAPVAAGEWVTECAHACMSDLVHHTAFPPRLWKNVLIGHSFRGFFWSQELTQRISSCTPCTLHCHGRTSPFSPVFLRFIASGRADVLRLHLLSANHVLVAVLHWDDLQASWQTVTSGQEHALKV